MKNIFSLIYNTGLSALKCFNNVCKKRALMFFLIGLWFLMVPGSAFSTESILIKKHKSSLVSYWTFNEGRSVIVGDSSGKNNHGLIQGDPKKFSWSTDSLNGTSVSFSGGSFIQVENTPSLSVSGDLTISCWILPRNVSSKSKIISKRNLDNEFALYLIGIEKGKIFGGIGNGKEVSLISKEHNIAKGVWHFVVLVYDSRQKVLKLFLNGKKIGETSAIQSISTGNARLCIGADYEGMTDFFDGVIDNVAIFNTAIPDSDISEEAGNYDILSVRALNDRQIEARRRQFLIGNWDFDIGHGNIIRDRSGSNNHGILKNMEVDSWKDSFIGANLLFDGVDDSMLVKHSSYLDLKRGFTISAWLYPTSFGERRKIIAKRKESKKYNFYLIGEDRGKLYAGIGNGKDITLTPKMTALQRNKWQHVAVTFDLFKGKLILYVNGKKVEEAACNHMVDALDANLVIGGDLDGQADFFNGMIDEVKIYSIGLPAMSIQNIYDKAYYRFKAAEEQRVRLKKIKGEIENFKAKLIDINNKLGILEDIGSAEKGGEEEFLKYLTERYQRKQKELDYQKKVKQKKIKSTNNTIVRLTQEINIMHDILSMQKIKEETVSEDLSLGLKEMDKQIQKGEAIKKKLVELNNKAGVKIKGKAKELKERIVSLNSDIQRRKSQIKLLASELEVPLSFPTLFYQKLSEREPEFKRLFQEQQEKSRYLTSLDKIKGRYEKEISEKKKRFSAFIKENRQKLSQKISELSKVSLDTEETVPSYPYGESYKNWLPEILKTYKKEKNILEQAETLLIKRVERHKGLLIEYERKLKSVNKSIKDKKNALQVTLKKLNEPQEIPVSISEYIPKKLKEMRKQFKTNKFVLDALDKRLKQASSKLKNKIIEENRNKIVSLKDDIQQEIIKINNINSELGIKEEILPAFKKSGLPDVSLAGYYKFDTEKSYSENDFTGKSSPMSLMNFEFGGWDSGRYKTALQFNGVNTYGRINKINLQDPGHFSILFWFYPDRFWGERTILYMGVLGKTSIIFIEEDENKLICGLGNFKSIRRFNLNIKLKKNTWYHFAMTVDQKAKAFNIYLDGKNVLRQTLPFNINFGEPLWVGSATGKQKFFSGRIDELKFYQGIVTAGMLGNKMKEERIEVAIDDMDRLEDLLKELRVKKQQKTQLVEKTRREREIKRQELVDKIKQKSAELNSIFKKLGQEQRQIKIIRGQEKQIYRDLITKISSKKREIEGRKRAAEKRRKEIVATISREKTALKNILEELKEGPVPFFEVTDGREEEVLEKIVSLKKKKEKELKLKKERERREAELRRKEEEENRKNELAKYRSEMQLLIRNTRDIDQKLGIKDSDLKEIDLGMENVKGLVGYFKFDKAVERYVDNETGKDIKLSIHNIRDATWVNGKYNGSLELNGVDSYAVIKNLDLFIKDNFTILLWINPMRFWGNRKILNSGDAQSEKGVLTIEERENKLYAGAGKGRFMKSIVSGGKVKLRPKIWQHIIIRVSKGRADLFFNGEKIVSTKLRDSFSFETETYLGSEKGKGEFFSGHIDELKIYNRALTDTEIYKGGREIEYTASGNVLDKLKKYVQKLKDNLNRKKVQLDTKLEEERKNRVRILMEINNEKIKLNEILRELGEPLREDIKVAKGGEERYLAQIRSSLRRKKTALDKKINEQKKEIERIRASFDKEKERLKNILSKLGEKTYIDIKFDDKNADRSLNTIRNKRREKEKIYLQKAESERQRRAILRREIEMLTKDLNEVLIDLKEPVEKVNIVEGQERQILSALEERITIKRKVLQEKKRKETERRAAFRKDIINVRIELAQVMIDLGESAPSEKEINYGEEEAELKRLKRKLADARSKLQKKRRLEKIRKEKALADIEKEKELLRAFLQKVGEDISQYDFTVIEGQEKKTLRRIVQVRVEKEQEYKQKIEEEKRRKKQEKRERQKYLEVKIKKERVKLKEIYQQLGVTGEIPTIGEVKGVEAENLLSYYRFEEGYGEKINDWQNAESQIVLKGTDVDTWTEGRFGKAIFFNGVSSFGTIDVPNKIKKLPPVTISMWIYPTRFWGSRTILMLNEENNSNGSLAVSIDENELFVSMKKRGIDFKLKRKAVLFRNNWYHVAVVYNQSLSRLTLFVNNKMISHISLDADIKKIDRIFLGSKEGKQEFFAGRIDELKIFSKAFSKKDIIRLGEELKVQEVFEDVDNMEIHYKELTEKVKNAQNKLNKKNSKEKERVDAVKQKIKQEKSELISLLKKLGEPPIVSVVIKEGREEEALESLRKQKKQKKELLDNLLKEKKEKRKRLLAEIETRWQQLNKIFKKLGEQAVLKPMPREGEEEKDLKEINNKLKVKKALLAKNQEEERILRRQLRLKIKEAKVHLEILRDKLGIRERVVVDMTPGKEEAVLATINNEIERREKELVLKLEKVRHTRRKEFLEKIEEKKKDLYSIMDKLGETDRPEFKAPEGKEINVLKRIDTLIVQKREKYRDIQKEKQRQLMKHRSEFLAYLDKLNDVLNKLNEPSSRVAFNEETPERSITDIKDLVKIKTIELRKREEEEKKAQEELKQNRKMLVKSLEEEKQSVLKLAAVLNKTNYKLPIVVGVSKENKKEKLLIYYDCNVPTYNSIPNKALGRYSATLVDIRKDNWVDGKFGKSLELNGVNNYASVKGIECPVKNGASVMMWIYPTRFWGIRSIAVLEGKDARLKLAVEDDKLYLQFHNSYQKKVYDKIFKLKKNDWQHVALTYDDRTKKVQLYLSGKKVFERYLELNLTGNIDEFVLGASKGGSEFFSGRVDEVRLYNHVINEANIEKKMMEKKIVTAEETLEVINLKLVKLQREKKLLEEEYNEMQRKIREERERVLQQIEKEIVKVNDIKEKLGEGADYRIRIPEGQEKESLAKVINERKKIEGLWQKHLTKKKNIREKYLALIEKEKVKLIDFKKKLGEVPIYQIDIVEGYEKDVYQKVKQDRLKKEEQWNHKVEGEKREKRIAMLKEIEKLQTDLNSAKKELKEKRYPIREISEGKEEETRKRLKTELASAKKRLKKKKEQEKLVLTKKLEKEKKEKLIKSISSLTGDVKKLEKELGIKTAESLLKKQFIKDRSLKTYLKFDETGGFSADDTSGYNNTGFIRGTDIYQWDSGKYGNALLFSGVVGYMEVQASPALSNIEDLTSLMWVYPKRFFDNRTIFYYSSKDGKRYLKLRMKEDRLYIDIVNYNERVNIDTGIVLKKNKWQHLGFAYSSNTTRLQIFFNGRQIADEKTKIRLIIENQPVILGSMIRKEFFAGKIDEFKLFNRILTSKEVLKNVEELVVDEGSSFRKMAIGKLEKRFADLTVKKEGLLKKAEKEREKNIKQREDDEKRKKMLEEKRKLLASQREKDEEKQRQIEKEKEREKEREKEKESLSEPTKEAERLKQRFAMLKRSLEEEKAPIGKEKEREKEKDKKLPIIMHLDFEKITGTNILKSKKGKIKAELSNLTKNDLVDSPDGKGLNIGHGGFVKIDRSSSLALEKGFTISFWMRAKTTNNSVLVEKGTFRIEIIDEKLTVYFSNRRDKKLDYELEKEKWYALAVSFNVFTGDFKLFVNGANVASTNINEDISLMAGGIFIGKGKNDSASTFKGIVDNFQLFSEEVSGQELMIKSPFNIEIDFIKGNKTFSKTAVMSIKADNASHFKIFESSDRRKAKWERMRPHKILILSPSEGKKEIKCVVKSWYGVESKEKTLFIEVIKEKPSVKLYSPLENTTVTGRR